MYHKDSVVSPYLNLLNRTEQLLLRMKSSMENFNSCAVKNDNTRGIVQWFQLQFRIHTLD